MTDHTNDQVVGITISTNIVPDKYLISEDRPTKPVSNDSFWESERPSRYTLKNDSNGIKTVYLYVMSSTGDISDGAVATINLDSLYPQLSSVNMSQSLVGLTVEFISGNFYLREGPFDVTFNFSETLSTTPAINILYNGSIVNSFNGLLVRVDSSTFKGQYTVTSGTLEGTYLISYSCTDNTGHETNEAVFVAGGIVVDHTSPDLQTFALDGKDPTIGAVYSKTRFLQIQIEPNDSSGIKGWIVTDNVSYVPSATSQWEVLGTYLILTNSISMHNITFWYIDNAWNIHFSTANIFYDPQTPVVSVQVNVTPNSVLTNQQVILTLDISNTGSGLADTPNLSYSAPGKTPQVLSLQLLAGGQYRSTLNVSTYTGQGQGVFSVRATDNEGHFFDETIALWYQGVSYDPFYIVSHNLKTPSFYMFDQDTLLSMDANDQIVGVTITNDEQAVAWYIGESLITPSLGSELWSSTRPGSFTFKNDHEEVKSVCLWIKDGVGRISQRSLSTINYDLTNPYISSIQLFNSSTLQQLTSIGNTYYLRVGTYNITFNMGEGLIITPSISFIASLLTVNNTLTRVNDRIFTSQYVVTNGSLEGSYGVYYSATDNAGNLSTHQLFNSETLILDVRKPTVNIELIDVDSGSNLYTNSRNVLLSRSIEELYIRGYLITENKTFIANVDSSWMSSLSTNYVIQAAGNGEKEVILWAIDNAWNISSGSYAITLDTQVPTATIELPVPASFINIGEHRITLNVGGIVSGLTTTPSLLFVPNNKAPISIILEPKALGQYVATLSIT
ncbi:MAG: hypothetical protein WCH76_01315, partial [Candidatus Riflemargulisbacteria bacterium]